MAKYKMRELPDLRRTGRRQLYPYLEISRQMSTSELIARIQAGNTFTQADVQGVLSALSQHIALAVSEGCSVKLEGIGTFRASLSLVQGAEGEQPDSVTRRNAQSICIRTLRFRPDSRLVADANRHFRPTRTPSALLTASPYKAEERLALAQAHLAVHPFIRVADYCALTGLRKTAAQKELRKWASDAGSEIKTVGRGGHKVYVRKTDD